MTDTELADHLDRLADEEEGDDIQLVLGLNVVRRLTAALRRCQPPATAANVDEAWERLIKARGVNATYGEPPCDWQVRSDAAMKAELAAILSEARTCPPVAVPEDVLKLADDIVRCAELDPSEWFPPTTLESLARFVLSLAARS